MHDRSQIDTQLQAFCEKLVPIEAAYRGHATLSYCVIRRGGAWQLYSAKLRLDDTAPVNRGEFESAMVRAGRVPFNNREMGAREMLDKLFGPLPIDGPSVGLEPDPTSGYSVYDVPHHRIPGERAAFATLKLRGARDWQMVDRDEIGWHLRGSRLPYESLDELCGDFDVGAEPGGIEVVAAPVIRIRPTSAVESGWARIEVECSAELDQRLCRLSFRVLQGAEVKRRVAVSGEDLGWVEEAGRKIGTHQVEVSDGEAIDCAASYLGETHHQAWLMDRSSVRNPRRAAFEPSDEHLAEMRVLLSMDSEKQHAKGFESAVAWLLWMLGFNPAHLCNSGHHDNAPDLLVECNGNLVVVECTLGQLKADKRSKLGARCIDIRKSLIASRNLDSYVLPVMVTRATREQAVADIKEAAAEGQHVLTRDDLLLLLDRTRQAYSAASILGEWRRALEAAQASTRTHRAADW